MCKDKNGAAKPQQYCSYLLDEIAIIKCSALNFFPSYCICYCYFIIQLISKMLFKCHQERREAKINPF